MRLFIAILLSEEIKDALIDLQNAMKDSGVYGSYTRPENMHLTLAFIGDYDDPDYVRCIIDRIDMRPFEVSLSGIGAFRDLWWAGLNESPALRAVIRRLRRELAEAEIPFDRKKFSPHITLIRRADGKPGDIGEELAKCEGMSMTVDRISLMRSERGKHGMIYTEL